MKRGKEESMNSEPLFPRLNVNDREVGGPRAPPRNKMALYEQLSVPSQRLKSTSSQGHGKNVSTFTSYDVPNAPPSGQLCERTHSQRLGNTTLSTEIIQSGRTFKRVSKDIDVTRNGSSSNSHHQHTPSRAIGSYHRTVDDENDNDFTVPTCFQSGISSTKNCSDSNLNHDGNLYNEIGVRCFVEIDTTDKGDDSWVRKEFCAKEDTFNQQTEYGATELQENEDVVINDISNESDSVLDMAICPDDVVGVIGPKHFWKARRAIVNQQRVFAMQVFELHRLIKVQKLIAASPDMIKVDITITPSPYINSPETFNKNKEPTTMQKTPFQNVEANSNQTEENNKVEDAPTNMMTPNPWCFHPNLNQWLMPIMSPSEGLIYKPYPSGPSPLPFYGDVPNQMGFPMLPYNVLYHQSPPMYYPVPYALPSTNPNEQASAQKPLLLEKQTSNLSCNFSNPVSEVISGQVQGSNCVNQVMNTVNSENPNVVIRVVPHKAMLASESAAWIFRSIQEERKRSKS